MGFITKEIREGKDLYAAKEKTKNIELAIINGATEEQADAIAMLCTDRHYIHSNKSDVFLAESGNAQEISDLLSPCSNSSINEYLVKAGLPRIEYAYSFDDDTSNDYLYELEGMTYEEAEEKTNKVMEQFDKDIIKYIKEFDEKYNTHFAPTGEGRAMGLK